MKREFFIVVCIIILVIIGHISTQNYTNKFFGNISSDLNELESKIQIGNTSNSELKQDIAEIEDKWKEKYDILAYYIEHDELEKVQTQLVGLEANIDVEEYDESVEKIKTCLYILEHIKDKDSLKLVNIF